MITQVDGLGDLLNHYDTYLIDQFGVLHDGVNPYPNAVESLTKLKASGKTVVIVSNSGKRSAINRTRMNTLGIDETLYDHFVTSGDVAHQHLQDHLAGKATQSCFLISRDDDTSAINDLGLNLTDNPDAADLIIIGGSEGDMFDERHYMQLLKKAASKNTLCLCTNPDKKMLTPDGLRFGAGRIAEIYEEQGGDVVWIGKPYKAIYSHIFQILSLKSKKRTLCIGDSIEHDIAGGKDSELHTLLVRTGIVSGISYNDLMGQFECKGVTPDYIAGEFRI